MEEFSFSTRIFFGEGALERLRRVQDKKVMIVTDRFMAGIGVPDKVAGHLTRCQVSVFDGVVPDPPIEVVAAGVQALQDCGAEVMIAVGGGSTIDAAKAIRAVAKQTQHIDTDRWECFAVPTTSGTGSEVTDYAVITDRAKGIKYPLDSQALRPPVAILVPELTVSAPASVTADAGMDVLTHALEAYVSKGANDFSDALCEKAVSLVFRFLPLAFQDGTNLLAREKMHNASCMAGLAFNSAGLGLNHGMAHAIGAKLHIAHGRINAMLLPHIIEYNSEINLYSRSKSSYAPCVQKYCNMARILGVNNLNEVVTVHALINQVRFMATEMHMPTSVSEALPKLTKEEYEAQISLMAKNALQDGCTATNPRIPTEDDVIELYKKIW